MNILVIIGTLNFYLYLAVNTNISVQLRIKAKIENIAPLFWTLSEVIPDRSKNYERSSPIIETKRSYTAYNK
jgi:hypothetical protein